VDFTHPEACPWYASHLHRLVDMSVGSFKTDFGERIPTGVSWYNGADPQKMHNHYAFIYNELVWNVLCEVARNLFCLTAPVYSPHYIK